MATTVDDLLRMLELDELGGGRFRGWTPPTKRQQTFGGQVAAQATMAAHLTVPRERVLHSLHANYLRRGDPAASIDYEVEDLREGRTFSSRRVLAKQGDRILFALSASFRPERPEALAHQEPMPEAPDPKSLPTFPERIEADPDLWITGHREMGGFDVRYVGDPRYGVEAAPGRLNRQQVWLRVPTPLPDDPVLHTCGLVYISDVTLLGAILQPHGIAPGDPSLGMASVDHAMWLHRPARLDRWLLYESASPSASHDLGLAHGRMFTRAGTLVASTMQEGLLRRR